MQAKDEELVRRAQNSDNEAFEELHGRYKGRIMNYLFRFFGNYTTAQDITQETFIHIYVHIASYRPIGTVSSWIYKIATNLARNEYKRIKRKQAASLDESVTEDKSIIFSETIDTKEVSPEDAAKRKELETALQKAISALPPKLREAFVLCQIKGMTAEEAARILNCKPHAVEMRLCRAEAQLHKHVKWGKYI